MSIRQLSLVFAVHAALMTTLAHAQQEARITIVQPGINLLKDDVKFLVGIAPGPLQKNWKILEKDLIDAFGQGVNPGQPIRIDFVFGKNLNYEMHFPVDKLKGEGGFLQNVEAFWPEQKVLAPNYYDLALNKKSTSKLYLRYANNYGSIATTSTAVPATIAPPITKGVAELLQGGVDIAAEMKNSAEDIAARRANFKSLRTQLEAGLVFKRGEDKNVFELRKLSSVQQLTEAERFLAETEQLKVDWTTDVKTAQGTGRFSLSALAGTDLAKSVQEFSSKPSYFANVKSHDNGVVTSRLNFPLDGLRQTHLKEFYKAVRPTLDAEIGSYAALKTPEQKGAAKSAANVLLDMLDAGVATGSLDTYIDMYTTADNKRSMVCGIRSADGTAAEGILSVLAKIKEDLQPKLNVEKHGDAGIHQISVTASRLAKFQKVFPGEKVFYVATTKNAVWGAAGPNSITDLKSAIDQAAQPAPEKVDPAFFSFAARTDVLVDMLEILQPEKVAGAVKTKEALQREKEMEKYRKLAADAVVGCTPLATGQTSRNGDKIEGTVQVNQCFLRFIGSIFGDVANQFK